MSVTEQNAVVLIPSLQPDNKLVDYVNELKNKGFSHIVVVDDGSGEKYKQVFDTIAAISGCSVCTHPVNRGKGAALKTGYAYIAENLSQFSGVITADSDGQHKADDCIKLSEALLRGEDCLYLGSRDFSLPDIPPKSRMGNRITSGVFAALYGKYLPDTQTGLRAFPMSRLQFMTDIVGERYEYEMNVLIACCRNHMEMKTIPIETVYENNNAGSHFNPIKDSMKIYKVIFANFFKFMGASIICFLVDFTLAWILARLLPHAGVSQVNALWLSGFGARIVSSVVNFLLNRSFVFKLKKGKGTVWKYALTCVIVICLSNLGVTLFTYIGMNDRVAKLICDCLLYFLSYNMQNRWVFSEHTEK